jgi:hypothetical protein
LPPTGNRKRKSKKQGKLQKSMSCRPVGELEFDEVKGFMDLGFQFKKEYISPRMISVVPGLQRLCLLQSESQLMDDGSTENDDDDIVKRPRSKSKEFKRKHGLRPYENVICITTLCSNPLPEQDYPAGIQDLQ